MYWSAAFLSYSNEVFVEWKDLASWSYVELPSFFSSPSFLFDYTVKAFFFFLEEQCQGSRGGILFVTYKKTWGRHSLQARLFFSNKNFTIAIRDRSIHSHVTL